jgi:hypothetical protein
MLHRRLHMQRFLAPSLQHPQPPAGDVGVLDCTETKAALELLIEHASSTFFSKQNCSTGLSKHGSTPP